MYIDTRDLVSLLLPLLACTTSGVTMNAVNKYINCCVSASSCLDSFVLVVANALSFHCPFKVSTSHLVMHPIQRSACICL